MQQHFKHISSFPSPGNFASTKEDWTGVHGQSNVLIDCTAKEVYYPMHWTPLSMKFCFNGTEFYQGKKSFRYGVDDSNFLVLNQDKVYESYIHSPHQVSSVTVNFSELFARLSFNALVGKGDVIDREFHTPGELPHFFEQLHPINTDVMIALKQLRNCCKNDAGDLALIEELFFTLFEQLVVLQRQGLTDSKDIPKIKHTTRIELFKRMHLAKDYLYSCYAGDIQLDDLSKITFINPYYLLRLFKSCFMVTPHRFLTQRRIDVSKKLLLQGYSVTDACQMVGFKDLSSFGKLFKKETGQSPKKFSSAAKPA